MRLLTSVPGMVEPQKVSCAETVFQRRHLGHRQAHLHRKCGDPCCSAGGELNRGRGVGGEPGRGRSSCLILGRSAALAIDMDPNINRAFNNMLHLFVINGYDRQRLQRGDGFRLRLVGELDRIE
jgi:hypothetical protein